jgi:hypothetical protein
VASHAGERRRVMHIVTGQFCDSDSYMELGAALERNRDLVKISRYERRKLARYEVSSRPAELSRLRAISANRNKAKAARKARRKARK